MCGIAGFCNRQKTWREDIERMKEQLISRGPDAEGSWCNDSQDVTLGHRRLSILDLSPGGGQPMVSHSGRFVISYNGEIYNCREVEKSCAGKDFWEHCMEARIRRFYSKPWKPMA